MSVSFQLFVESVVAEYWSVSRFPQRFEEKPLYATVMDGCTTMLSLLSSNPRQIYWLYAPTVRFAVGLSSSAKAIPVNMERHTPVAATPASNFLATLLIFLLLFYKL